MAETDTAKALFVNLLGSNGGDIAKRLFVLMVTAIAVLPRMPLDPPCPWSIGGFLSRPFRKCVLLLAFQYTLRHALHFTRIVSRFSGAIEGILLSFMGLLTPYLLRGYLMDRINIPNGPGRGLQVWVVAYAILSLLGFSLIVYTGDERFWIFKKIADVISVIPVLRTLQWYNMVTTGQARYPGRGPVLSQVMALCEYFTTGFHLVDALSKVCAFLGIIDMTDPTTKLILKGFYSGTHYIVYLRVLCHSIFLNYIDEMQSLQPATCDGDDDGVETPPSSEALTVSKRARH